MGSAVDFKDEIAYATSLARPFEQLATDIKWLDSYAQQNSVFALILFKHFRQTIFEQHDNMFNKMAI